MSSTARELGGVFGVAIAVAVFSAAGGYASAQDFTDGFRAAFAAAAVLSVPPPSPRRSPPRGPLPRRRPRRRPRAPPAHPRTRRSPMTHTLVRYRVAPDRAAENEALVRAVDEEPARLRPPGLRYSTHVLEDGVTFVHQAIVDTPDGVNPLLELPAFERFQAGIPGALRGAAAGPAPAHGRALRRERLNPVDGRLHVAAVLDRDRAIHLSQYSPRRSPGGLVALRRSRRQRSRPAAASRSSDTPCTEGARAPPGRGRPSSTPR